MARFDSQIKLAKRLIARNGETSTLRRQTPGTPADPAKPWKPGAPSFADFKVSAVWLSFEVERVDGDLVQSGDQQVFIAASDLAVAPDPTTDHLVRANGEKWTIVRSDQLVPNGQEILHVLQAR